MRRTLPAAGLDAVFSAGTTAAPDRDSLDAETLFEVLGNERRRACLQRLADRETGLSVSDLGRQVARTVTDTETESDAVYDSVYISLCQTHLPKLDAVGLVDYNREEKRVAHGPRFDAVRQQFQTAHTTDHQPADDRRTGLVVSALTAAVAALALLSPPVARTALLFGLLGVHLFTLASTATLSY